MEQTSFKFVGEGGGDFDQFEGMPGGSFKFDTCMCFCCLFTVLFITGIVWIFFFGPERQCTLASGMLVDSGWYGGRNGAEYCNTCRCQDGVLSCTKNVCSTTVGMFVLSLASGLATAASQTMVQDITTTTLRTYTCHESGQWSLQHAHWCCQNHHIGCPQSVPFDCNAHFSNWQVAWSAGKKFYCCATTGRGCEAAAGQTTTTAAVDAEALFDCNAGWHGCYHCLLTEWSVAKLAFCCKYHQRGCPSQVTR